MAKVKTFLQPAKPGQQKGTVMHQFRCPGCGRLHNFDTRWTYNYKKDNPTVRPSINVTWLEGPKREKMICHSFITDGSIQFLSDCTHDRVNETLVLPEIK